MSNPVLSEASLYTNNDVNANLIIPFKDRAEFSALTDILLRKHYHHIVFQADFSAHAAIPYLKALLLYFTAIRKAELIIIDRRLKDLSEIMHLIEASRDTLYLVAFKDAEVLESQPYLQDQLYALCQNANCRVLLLNQYLIADDEDKFYYFTPQALTTPELMELLQYYCIDLATHHQVGIPEDMLPFAYHLAKRFLPADESIKNTLLVIDSAAARADSLSDHREPTLGLAALNDVISRITQIPADKLHKLNFNVDELIQDLQQAVTGQDEAINQIAKEIQHSFTALHIQQASRPLMGFLFAGCKFTGKKTMALALTKYLFEQKLIFSLAYKHKYNAKSILDITFHRYSEKNACTLKQLICNTPYAVIYMEDVDSISLTAQQQLQEILTTGYLNEDDKQYDFSNAIIILTTQLGAPLLAKTIETDKDEIEDDGPLDLIKFVNSERKSHVAYNKDQSQLTQLMTTKLSFCNNLKIIPFTPLTRTALEKIIFKKLHALIQQLKTQYDIELGYAPEIIRYLTDTAFMSQKKETGEVDVDKTFNGVYQSIEKVLLNRILPKALFLQLNETGQRLRCA